MSARYLSADDFLPAMMGQAVDFDVPGLGTVRVRGLSVGEIAEIRRSSRENGAVLLARTIAVGMVEPQLTVEQLLAAPAGIAPKYEAIAIRIAELSGMAEDQATLDDFRGGGS